MNGKDKNHERQNHSDHPCPCKYALRIRGRQDVPCRLALVELSNGDREVHAMAAINGGPIEDVSDSGAVLVHV